MWQQAKNLYHLFVAWLAVASYRYPAKNLTVIGVTGTDGKTTTATTLAHILRTNGKKVGLLSTVGAYIDTDRYELGLHVTTPSAFTVQKFLRKMVDNKCEIAVIEATSHGLDQNRLLGCHFRYGVLTNITHEHLDYHKSMERYTLAKLKLFRGVAVAFINRDGPWFATLTPLLHVPKIVSFGITESADINPKTFQFSWHLDQDYNRANALGAVAVAKEIGLPDDAIAEALVTFPGVAGRMQHIESAQGFSVIVDFAHTPNAIEQVLQAVRPQTTGRIIAVFGSAGLRDKAKRPITGAVAAKHANISIVTADDPATEDVIEITNQIVSGMIKAGAKEVAVEGLNNNQQQRVFVRIPNRKEAITAAITIARKGDTVVLLGKGHQKSLSIGKSELPWDEAAIAKQVIQSRG